MIIEKTFYAIRCDNCGVIHRWDEGEYWSDKGMAWEMAGESDWEMIEDKHYCDECYGVGDDDETIINLNRKKQF